MTMALPAAPQKALTLAAVFGDGSWVKPKRRRALVLPLPLVAVVTERQNKQKIHAFLKILNISQLSSVRYLI